MVGVLVCEDMWSSDGPPEAQAAAGAQVLLTLNASPFHRGKPDGRRGLASAVARRNGVPVVYVNCVGGHDELAFDGDSLVVDPDGEVIYRAAQFEPEHFWVDLQLGPARPALAARTVHTRAYRPRAPRPATASRPRLSEPAQIWRALVVGLRDFAAQSGSRSAVLGLSGGIDSAICAAIAVDALGPANVLGVAMPGPASSSAELSNARRLAANLGMAFEVIDVHGALSALSAGVGAALGFAPAARTDAELLARARTDILMAVSDERGDLVLATGNKSELSIGSATLYGDMAGDFAPIKDCPKTLLYTLAEHRNWIAPVIPAEIIARTPSAQLGGEAGLPPYAELDPIVERYVERVEGLAEITAAGFDPVVVRGVLQLVDDAEFKRRQTPPGTKITARAFGQDRRMPISNAWRPFRREQIEVAGEAVLLAPAAEAETRAHPVVGETPRAQEPIPGP